MNQQTSLSPSINDSQQQIKGYANRKEIVRWLLQAPQEIRFKLTPTFNRFQRPDDFIFTVANSAAAMMMGRPLESLIGHKLIEVLGIHPFHHFYQNYLRTYLYKTPLVQNIEMPLLARKNKYIVHEAEVVEEELVVTIKVASKEVVSPSVTDSVKTEGSENQLITEALQVASETTPLATTQEKEEEEKKAVIISAQEVAIPEAEQTPTAEAKVVAINETPSATALQEDPITPIVEVESAQTEIASEQEPLAQKSPTPEATNIDLLASQQIAMNGKIEYVNEAVCDTLELAEYNHQEVFIQDMLHKVSQLPYHFALLQAKAKQVVKNLPLIFVTKSKKYVKVKGRIEPQTQGGQVTGLRLYYQVLQHTTDFHQVAAFGKVPAFNSF